MDKELAKFSSISTIHRVPLSNINTDSLNETLNDSFENIYERNKQLLGPEAENIEDEANLIHLEDNLSSLSSNSDIKMSAEGANPTAQSNSPKQQQQQQDKNPRKDHYSYSYSYKTADPESGMPGVSTVEVNESVTEEVGPDGSKIIRRHQQEKQINKITQVVTQRVIKRQYIDPNTGQVIEYDPNNELFANLPPETVFEEHTVISDEAAQPPVVSTTCVSKSTPPPRWPKPDLSQFANLGINENDYVDNLAKYSTMNTVKQAFKIKSHPEDNQGYPEEKNMDYDPDDINCYPDDDLPYEGLLPVKNIPNDGRRVNGGGGSGGSTSGSSSSPVLFDPNSDMPIVSSNGYHKTVLTTQKSRQASGADLGGVGTYATVLPLGTVTPRQQQNSNYAYLQQHNHNHQQQHSIYSTNTTQYVSTNPKYNLDHNYIYGTSQQQMNFMGKQQPSPSLNHSNEYGSFFFFTF